MEPTVTSMLEREVKLRFDDPEAARLAIVATGATPLRRRRLQQDVLLDTDDDVMRRQRCVLRIRTEAGASVVTLKRPVEARTTMKLKTTQETIARCHAVLPDGDSMEVTKSCSQGDIRAHLLPDRP